MSERKSFLEGINLYCPEYVFAPNLWTATFIEALDTINISRKNVLEIGVGSGAVAIYCLKKDATYLGTDIDQRVLNIARHNIEANTSETDQRRYSLKYSDLFKNFETKAKYDFICGCLPQIPLIYDDDFHHDYDKSKYYVLRDNSSAYNVLGFELCKETLIQAKDYLAPHGSVVLMLNGRFGLELLLNMFIEQDYSPNIITEGVSPLSNSISLNPFINAEKQGVSCSFYEDYNCTTKITTESAEEKRRDGLEIYYKIFAIQGFLKIK